MTGFIDIASGFSQAAIDALVAEADALYLGGAIVETPLPDTPFDVTDYGVVGNGVADNTSALVALAGNTGVTNWYFPAGDFRMEAVSIPAHVVAVYGEGTITSISNGDSGYTIGSLYVETAHQDLVIDGLTFAGESGYVGNQYYGMLQLGSAGDSTDNTQIRNCTFDGALRAADQLRVFAREDVGDHTNLKVYNNYFINGSYFAMELFNITDNPTDDMAGLEGLVITGNLIGVSGGTKNGWGIGIGAIRKGCRIYNNEVYAVNMCVEVIQSKGALVYNNYCDADEDAIHEGVDHTGGNVLTLGVNSYYNNHCIAGQYSFHSYASSASEVYNNYLGNRVYVYDTSGTYDQMAHLYDNTIASVRHLPVDLRFTSANFTGGPIENNEIYSSTTFTDTYTIGSDTATSVVILENNDMYQTVSPNFGYDASKFTNAGNTGNTFEVPYTGEIPTSRPGAGLLP